MPQQLAIRLTINGQPFMGHVSPRLLLSDFLGENVGLTGVRVRCEQGICGAWTILVDGQTARACLLLLARPRVHFVGQVVAVVAAVDRYVAEDAVELVEVDYHALPAMAYPKAADEPGGPLVHKAWGDTLFLDRPGKFADIEAAFVQAYLVWQQAYRTPRHTRFPMEGWSSIADYDPATGVLTLYAATQMPHLLRTGLADPLGLGEHDVSVIAPDAGGGFGIKSHLLPEEIAICVLSMRLGRRVKWAEDTTEHLAASIHARAHVHRVQVAAKRDGTILAIKADLLVDAGAYSVWPWTAAMEVGMAVNMIPGPYRIGAVVRCMAGARPGKRRTRCGTTCSPWLPTCWRPTPMIWRSPTASSRSGEARSPA